MSGRVYSWSWCVGGVRGWEAGEVAQEGSYPLGARAAPTVGLSIDGSSSSGCRRYPTDRTTVSHARAYVCPTACIGWSIDIWDNRVVPSFIDSKEHPLATPFFHHEDTACYEQVSTASSPLHPTAALTLPSSLRFALGSGHGSASSRRSASRRTTSGCRSPPPSAGRTRCKGTRSAAGTACTAWSSVWTGARRGGGV